jgi:hypothetical protein
MPAHRADHVRRGSIAYIERRPPPTPPDHIPPMRLWSHEQLDALEQATLEDMRANPVAYDREFFERLGEPLPPSSQMKMTKGRPPSDRWFAEVDSKIDQRRHAGGPKPWAPGERERLLQAPFHHDALASRRIYERPNGENPIRRHKADILSDALATRPPPCDAPSAQAIPQPYQPIPRYPEWGAALMNKGTGAAFDDNSGRRLAH